MEAGKRRKSMREEREKRRREGEREMRVHVEWRREEKA